MSDAHSSTSVQDESAPTYDAGYDHPDVGSPGHFVAEGPRAHGFLILYHDVTRLLLGEHSAVIKTYFALGTFTNASRESRPSIPTVARMVGMHERSVYRAIDRLQAMGLVGVMHTPGQVNRYRFRSPGEAGYPTPDTRVTPDTRIPKPLTPVSPKQEREQENVTDPHPVQISDVRAGAREGGRVEVVDRKADGSGTVIRAQRQPPAGGANERSSVPNREVPSGVALNDPYWAAGDGYHKQCLEKTLAAYPKPANYRDAMIAWQEVIGDSFITDPNMPQKVWDGLVLWKRHWKAEQTEPRYIPAFENWIRKRRWENAPGGQR